MNKDIIVNGRSNNFIVEITVYPNSVVFRVDDEKLPSFWLELTAKKELLQKILKEMEEKNDLADG